MSGHSLAQHVRSLAAYLPNGKLFEAKNILGSNFNQLLRGFSGELRTAEDYLVTLEKEYFPDETVLFLNEWESALGIPDGCFDGTGTADERRENILVKLAALGVQTAQDFIDLALIFGKIVDVHPLSDEAFPPYAVPFTPVLLHEGRFVIVVTGTDLVTGVPPYDVPFDLTGGESLMECVFKKLTPGNCALIFRNTN
jgi:uncharacterized protein YmfQ (DUF2313 family)